MSLFLSKKTLAIAVPMLFTASYWGMMKLILPILPQLASIFQVSNSKVHLMISVAFSFSGISSILWGLIINKYNSKSILLTITFCCIFALLATSLAKTIGTFSIFFISCCAMMNLFSVYSRWHPMSFFSNKEDIKQSLSLRHIGGYSAAFIAPFLAGWVYLYFGWRYIFIIMVVWIVFVLGILLYIGVKEPINSMINSPKDKETPSNYTLLMNCIHHKSFVVNSLALSCCAIVSQGYIVGLPFWLTDLHQLPVHRISYYLFPIFLPGILLPLFFKKLSSSYGSLKIVSLCTCLVFIAGIVFVIIWSLDSSIAWLWVLPGMLITICYTNLSPILSYRALKSVESSQAMASGILSVLSYFAGGIGIYISLSFNIHTIFLEGCFIILVSFILFLLLQSEKVLI